MKNTPRYKDITSAYPKAVYVLHYKIDDGHFKGKLKFNTFDELKTYLIKNTNKIFGWIFDCRYLPDFTQVETVRDINTILDKYNYGWWYLKVKIKIADNQNDIG